VVHTWAPLLMLPYKPPDATKHIWETLCSKNGANGFSMLQVSAKIFNCLYPTEAIFCSLRAEYGGPGARRGAMISFRSEQSTRSVAKSGKAYLGSAQLNPGNKCMHLNSDILH